MIKVSKILTSGWNRLALWLKPDGETIPVPDDSYHCRVIQGLFPEETRGMDDYELMTYGFSLGWIRLWALGNSVIIQGKNLDQNLLNAVQKFFCMNPVWAKAGRVDLEAGRFHLNLEMDEFLSANKATDLIRLSAA